MTSFASLTFLFMAALTNRNVFLHVIIYSENILSWYPIEVIILLMLWLLVFVADYSSSRMGTIYKDMAIPNIENVWIAFFCGGY